MCFNDPNIYLFIGQLFFYFSRCALTVNDTFDIQNDAHRKLVEMYIPSTDPDDNTLPYDRCNYFRYTNESTMNTTASRQKLKCSEWVYSDDIYGNTFAKEVKHLPETIAYIHCMNLA